MAKILVVDDENSVRMMIREMLEGGGHEILEASNGVEACQVFRQSKIDLVITDMVMPEKNGLDLILELKKDYPNIKIIGISGGGGITGRFEYLPIAKLIGAATVMEKPFQMSDLRNTVNQVLG
ncbi:MAG: response regulator [Gammaproteobacteria bacterium]